MLVLSIPTVNLISTKLTAVRMAILGLDRYLLVQAAKERGRFVFKQKLRIRCHWMITPEDKYD